MTMYEEMREKSKDAERHFHEVVVCEVENILKLVKDEDTYTREDVAEFIESFLYRLG